MTAISDAVQKKILAFPHPIIQALLLKHLNREAIQFITIFCQYEVKRAIDSPSRQQGLESTDLKEQCTIIKKTPLLALVYLIAPITVCDELTQQLLLQDPSKIVRICHDSDRLSFHAIPKILHHAPERIVEFILSGIQTLPKADRIAFFQKINFIQLLSASRNETSQASLIGTLTALPTTHMIESLKYGYYGNHGFVDALNIIKYESVVIALLEKLHGLLDQEQLYRLFKGHHAHEQPSALHIIFKRYSATIVQKTMSLLTALSEEQISTLLLHEYAETIDQLAVITPLSKGLLRKNDAITDVILQTLHLRPKLKTLVCQKTGPFSYQRSAMELALRSGNLPAIVYWIEQPEFDQPFKSIIASSMPMRLNPEILNYVDAQPLYACIQNMALDPSQHDTLLAQLAPKIKQNPGLLKTRWHQQKTLLHLALAQPATHASIWLIKQGIDVNAADTAGQTAWQIALSQKNIGVLLALAAHPQTCFFENEQQGLQCLETILAINHYPLISAVLSSLTREQHDKAITAVLATVFIQRAGHLHTTKQLHALEKALNQFADADTKPSLGDQLKSYCQAYEDVQTTFMMQYAAHQSRTSNESLSLNAAANRLILDLLHQCIDPLFEIERESARMSLISYLFLRPAEQLIEQFNAMSLTLSERLQLESILSQGLLKPAIYSSLSLESQQPLINWFQKDSEALHALVTLHCQQSDLTQIPARLLLDFTQHLNIDALQQAWDHRPIPALLLLTLHRAFHDPVRDEQRIITLLSKLPETFDALNNPPVTPSISRENLALHQLLELAVHPAVQKAIIQYLENLPADAPCLESIRSQCLSIDPQYPLIRGSLLHQLMIRWLKIEAPMQAVIPDQATFVAIFPRLSMQEALEVMHHHRQAMATFCIHLFEAINQHPQQDNLFPTWLRHFDAMMQSHTPPQQYPILNAFTPANISQLLDYALANRHQHHNDDTCRAEQLLRLLCQHQVHLNQVSQDAIKARLGCEDWNLLDDESLQVIAQNVLLEQHPLNTLTINGVWIQRLLTAPRFVAASTASVLARLVARYRAISLTLKHDELETLNQWISGKMPFAARQNASLKRIQRAMLDDPEKKNQLLAKRDRLMHFMVNDSIRALFHQLEEDCVALRATDNPIDTTLADAALTVYYTYHGQHITTLRSDRLFRLADFMFSHTLLRQGDLTIARNPLLQWLNEHLPHRNLQQYDLMQPFDIYLYNAQGKRIGYVDEFNHAMTLIDEAPHPLLDAPGIRPGMALFDKHRQRRGTLTSTSQFMSENLFQNETIALIVGKMPIDMLRQSKAALDLLIHALILNQSLAMAYQCTESRPHTEKRRWLEKKICQYLAQQAGSISIQTMHTLMEYHAPESIIHLLANTTDQTQALTWFHAILNHDIKRTAFFNPEFRAAWRQFLGNHDAALFLATFLANHQAPWFSEGLHCFADFAVHAKPCNILNKALHHFYQQTMTPEGESDETDHLLKKFIQSDALAGHVLRFVEASTQAQDISQFFEKCHIVPVIQSMTTQAISPDSAQYALLLLTFKTQHQQLFPQEEIRLSKRAGWQADELHHLTRWTQRHFNLGAPHDPEEQIGQRLIMELAFRCANFGQTNLFYTVDGLIDSSMIRRQLDRKPLHGLVAQFYQLPPALQARVRSWKASMRGWFDHQYQTNQEIRALLKTHDALIDWKQLIEDTWMEAKQDKIPLICAYLMNYSGAAQPVSQLIHQLMKHPSWGRDKENLYAISALMTRFPTRDISAAIFGSLIRVFTSNPDRLDHTFLMHLNQYYQQRHAPLQNQHQSGIADLKLIQYLGQQGHYALVESACRLFIEQTNLTNPLKKQLIHIANAARVEASLKPYQGRWFFAFLQWIKRSWYRTQQVSHWVKYCELPSESLGEELPRHIKSNVRGGEEITQQLNLMTLRTKLKNRYTLFIETHGAPTIATEASGASMACFRKP